jgi:hypothetical protein
VAFWVRRYRILVTAYAIGILFGVREYRLSRTMEAVAWPSDQWSEMTDVIAQIDPDEPDTKWLESKEALRQNDATKFGQLLEEALASDVKHNAFLLHDYAQLLLDNNADYLIANRAANRWRENYPTSRETLGLELGTGPRTPAEEALLEQALAQVPWIAGSRLESATGDDGNRRWVVQLAFRPATTIDLRDAIAAVTLLSLTEEQRSQFAVRCATLVDCTLEPRSR